MSGCDRMTTPLGTFRTKLLQLVFLLLNHSCHIVFFIVAMLCLSSFYFLFFAFFTVLACIIIHVYLAYILEVFTHCSSHF
jgi:hypothetical protein